MKTKTRDTLEEEIDNVFRNVQLSKTSHQGYIKKLRKYYDNTDLKTFWECFISCLKIPLSVGQRHPHVDNTLEFIAKFAVSFYSFSENDSIESMCPFLLKLFEFLLSHHNAKDPAVRFRICHLLNMLLDSMGEQAFIDDVLCDQITVSMMERLLDRSPKVRAQAVFALHRLQDPSERECPVIKLYIFHLSKDPIPEVRKAVLSSMGKNAETLQAVLRRTRDISEQVRKMAYDFISKVTVRSLKMQQRNQLLNDGLKDRSELVKKCVEKVLLPSWLQYYNQDYIKLLTALDVEMSTDTSILTLSSLFRHAQLNVLLEQLPLDKATKLIPMNALSSENVLYWRCIVNFIQENCGENLENVLPELSTFCAYIGDFLALVESEQSEVWEQQTKKFILLQLFEITANFDLADEVGRKNLDELILYTLTRSCCSEKIIECIVRRLEVVVPDANTRINALANVISEIRLPPVEPEEVVEVTPEERNELAVKKAKLNVMLLQMKEEEYEAAQRKDYVKAESLRQEVERLNKELHALTDKPEMFISDEDAKQDEKNDRETMVKCLTIMCTMLQCKSISSLTPTLYGLLQVALESLDHPDDAVHILALKAVSIYCILDKELAKKHIMMLFLQLTLEQENREIWVMALKGIFDLLLIYGLEHFDIMQDVPADNTTATTTTTNRSVKLYNETNEEHSIVSSRRSGQQEETGNFIKILTGLLDNANEELRTVATEGLCKLVLHRRIDGCTLLSRLIILCFNPATDGDVYLRQCLSSFFDSYLSRVPDASEALEAAFFPTLKIVCNAPEVSPLQDVDPYDIARFILGLTCTATKKNDTTSYCSHNNLAFAILADLLNPNSRIDNETLIKSLKDLNVQIDDDVSRENLLTAVDKVMDMITNFDKSLVKYVEQFKKRLITPDQSEQPAEEGTENEDNDSEDNI